MNYVGVSHNPLIRSLTFDPITDPGPGFPSIQVEDGENVQWKVVIDPSWWLDGGTILIPGSFP